MRQTERVEGAKGEREREGDRDREREIERERERKIDREKKIDRERGRQRQPETGRDEIIQSVRRERYARAPLLTMLFHMHIALTALCDFAHNTTRHRCLTMRTSNAANPSAVTMWVIA